MAVNLEGGEDVVYITAVQGEGDDDVERLLGANALLWLGRHVSGRRDRRRHLWVSSVLGEGATNESF